MTTQINPRAGKPAPLSSLIDVAKLVTAYFEARPDPAIAAQRVVFGTSGHRGSAFDVSFNENGTFSPSRKQSIAATGFALAAYPIGVERGFISRAAAVQRTLTTLRFFMAKPVRLRVSLCGILFYTSAVAHMDRFSANPRCVHAKAGHRLL